MPAESFYPYRTGAEMVLLHLDLPEREEQQASDESLPVYHCSGAEIQLRAAAIVPDAVWEKVFDETRASSSACEALAGGTKYGITLQACV